MSTTPSHPYQPPQPPPPGPQPQSGQPPYAQLPPGQAHPPYAPVPERMSPDTERTWAIASHLSSFVAAYVALGFLGPLVCMLIIGDRSPYARRQAVEALNFNLSWLIYLLISIPLMLIFIGFVLAAALGIAYLILVILGAVAASRGEEFRYPLTLRMVS